MARPHTPKIDETRRVDGTVAYSTRIMVDGDRRTVRLGDERDGVTRLMAERELARVIEEVRLGCWAPEDDGTSATRPREPEPPFAEVAKRFMAYKRSKQLRDSTLDFLAWALDAHLVPYFGRRRPSRISTDHVIAYSDHQVAQRERIVRLRARGEYLAGPRGGAMRELSNASINLTLRVLAEVLEWSAQKGWRAKAGNPAAGWRLAQRPRPVPVLEPDEIADLLAAVATPRACRRQSQAAMARAERITRLRDDEGLEWTAIAERVGVARSTAVYHYQRRRDLQAGRIGGARAMADRVFVAALLYSGARVAELCDLDVDDVALEHEKFSIRDSKTPDGVREVDMTRTLCVLVAEYFEARGWPAGSEPAFPDANGRRRDKGQVNKQVLAPAVRLANERRAARGLGRLPRVSAHVMRHTNITLGLEAGYPVQYVMEQVGHRHPTTTLKIYAKVLARRDREQLHERFDLLIGGGPAQREARADDLGRAA